MSKRGMFAPERFRKPVVITLLGLHICAYLGFSLWGNYEPFELFNILLLLSNAIIASLMLFSKRDLLIGAGIMFFIATHSFIGHRLAPDSLTNGAILMVNILVLYVGIRINESLSRVHWYAFIASFFVLFGVFILYLDNSEALFLLFLMLLAATARDLKLLAYFWCFTLSFTLFQPYSWESLIISFFVLTAVFKAKGSVDSSMSKLFLAVGLVLLFFVLLPILVVVMKEPLVNIEPVLKDPRIRAAIGRTFLTASISTAVLFFVTVPLAYAMSRLRFPGRTLLMSLIDMPVVVPQSVAGIALVSVLGRNQFIGQAIYDLTGVAVDNTMLGIVIAQVFVSLPFIAKSAIAAFDAVPVEFEMVGRTLKASSFQVFKRVTFPLASRGIFLGAVLAWARAAGEFGAVVILAPTPETAPVEAYRRFVSVGSAESAPMVVVLLLFSLFMFFCLQTGIRLLPKSQGQV